MDSDIWMAVFTSDREDEDDVLTSIVRSLGEKQRSITLAQRSITLANQFQRSITPKQRYK